MAEVLSQSAVRVIGAEWVFPPLRLVPLLLPVGEGVDAVDRADGKALVAPAAQFGNDDDVDSVVEDRAEVRRAVAQTGIAVDALEHLDAQWRVLPLRVSGPVLDPFVPGRAAHTCSRAIVRNLRLAQRERVPIGETQVRSDRGRRASGHPVHRSNDRSVERSIERSAITALVPVLALVPVWLLSLAIFWLPTRLFWRVPFWLFAAVHLGAIVIMFWRPLQTVLVMRMLGASRATQDEAARLEPAWRSVADRLDIKTKRYALAVLPSDDLNAFACGGSLLVITSYAIETLPRDEMTGVLAHELAHHLGFHTVSLTMRQWLSLPIYLLAQVGFFLQNVATAATRTFVSHSSALSAVGRLISGVLNVIAWVFLS